MELEPMKTIYGKAFSPGYVERIAAFIMNKLGLCPMNLEC